MRKSAKRVALRYAARPIRLPTREIKTLAKRLAQWLYQYGLPKPGRVIAQEYLPLTNVMGEEDIDFDHHADFSKSYFLSGPDEDAIRRLFEQGGLLDFFSNWRGVYLRGRGREIAFYRSKEQIPSARLGPALDDIRHLRRVFEEASRASKGAVS